MNDKILTKTVRVSQETRLFLLGEKYRWGFKSIDEYLKKKFPDILNKARGKK